MIGPSVYTEPTNSILASLSAVQRDILDFEIALYNECCVRPGSAAQSFVSVCTGNNSMDCPNITNSNVQEQIGSSANTVLCTCSSSAARVNDFAMAINKSSVCASGEWGVNFGGGLGPDWFKNAKKGTGAFINANNLKLPPKANSLDIHVVTNIQFSSAGYWLKAPIVGWYEIPSTNLPPLKWPQVNEVGFVVVVSVCLLTRFV